MSHRENEKLFNEIIKHLDLPDSAYEKAIKRYEEIGQWLGREESLCAGNDPHIFPQGSFRLGVAIRPISGEEVYDIDLACNLRSGVSPNTHSQEELKVLLGKELSLYQTSRQIKSPLEEKHRCWRLEYADSLKFHMDIVPCIPQDELKRKSLAISMESYGIQEHLAQQVSELAVGITDDRHINYRKHVPDWMISNPEGYAQWFENRMHPSAMFKVACESAQIDEVPIYKQKTPLQRVIQILKRHRDQMFANNSDSKPISIIITTLATSSYNGSSSIEETLKSVLIGLKQFIASNSDEVKNPVNPEENFADRWKMPAYNYLELKQHFRKWVEKLNKDFEFIFNSNELEMLSESLSNNLSIFIDKKKLATFLGLSQLAASNSSSLLRATTATLTTGSQNISFATSPRVPKKPDGFA